MKETANDAGIEKRVHPHLLRHTYAMMLRRRGVDVDVIADQIGHESIETTRHYYGKDPSMLRTRSTARSRRAPSVSG